MDKSWIGLPRNTSEYLEGLNQFLDFAFAHNSGLELIVCPCRKCGFKKLKKRNEVLDDLLRTPFLVEYTVWYRHGESLLGESSQSLPIRGESGIHQVANNANPMLNLVTDAFGGRGDCVFEDISPPHEGVFKDDIMSDLNEEPNVEDRGFCQLLKDGGQALYPGCTKFTKLSFLITLYNIKSLCGITDKGMSMLIELLCDAFEFANIPKSGYEAKTIIKALGLSYTEIHACPKDCMLYWGDDANRKDCKVCGASRYKLRKNDRVGSKKRKEQPAKIFCYFPLIPRLQRLFASSKTAKNMVWHSKNKKNDGMARHPRDSEAWKNFDERYPDFASDHRNVRLGLATDGFNPSRSLSNNYSIWPIILIPYNNPPWLCMKQTNFILSGIIPGKKMPGNDIDVYKQPMSKELKIFWEEGVETYDAFKNEVFKMRASLMWTISDFPALGNLSGWNIYTGLACPTCNFDARPLRLKCSRKWCFLGSRRFWDKGHRFRLNKVQFDGHVEDRDPPKRLSSSEILQQLEHVDVTLGKGTSGRKRSRDDSIEQWKRKSIFFELPYWEFNLLRHNLDVMHIEKNVCNNIIFTLLNDKDKRKDHLNARKDLVELKIRDELWPKEDGKTCPAALFTLEKQEIDFMLETLKDISVLDGYASNISSRVDLSARKLSGLKSHNSHVLLQELLPLAIRNIKPIQVSSPLVELSSCFKLICSKVVNTLELDKLQQRIALCLCHLEMLFPPSFFTVMVHLVVHLVEELRLS